MQDNALDDELLAKIKGVQIRAKHLVNDVFAGEYISAFKGRGMEFEEVREYQPGDDVRAIDWNVTARSETPFIKIFQDERELTVIFMVDVSASARFGTVKKFKNEVAAEITALLAYAAKKSNDKVGLIIFSDHVEHFIPPKKGRGHIWNLIREILTYESNSKKTDLTAPLEFLNNVVKRRSIVFLMSDFQGDGFQDKLQATFKNHDLIAVEIYDPKELSFPKIGFIELEDSETGEVVLIDTNSKKFRNEYETEARKKLVDNKKFFQKNGVDLIQVKTDEPYVDKIVKFFRNRESRR